MSQEEILDFKPPPRPEQVDDSRPKQMEDDKHRIGLCAIRADMIFGNDTWRRPAQAMHQKDRHAVGCAALLVGDAKHGSWDASEGRVQLR